MKNKETLFSKNNYDVQLEEILDKKDFDDESKSLILNILYKIEESYKNYSKVKVNVNLKSEIIEEIIEIIENKCDKIEMMQPQKTKIKFTVDKKNKSVKVFPNAVSLMEALHYLNTPRITKNMDILDKTITKAMSKGYALNNSEIIRDFNGWSWNNVLDNNTDKYYNLMYQDLLLLLGKQRANNILESNDIINKLLENFKELYGEKNANLLIISLEKTSTLIYMQKNKKNKDEVFEYLENKEKELKEINNKSEYIAKITIENNENMNTVGKIENILKNKQLLLKKFEEDEIKEKYKNLEEYKKSLKKIRNINLKKIKEKANLINPFEYVKRKGEIEKAVKSLINIKPLEKDKKAIYKSLIELQRIVISCLYRKIEVYDLKKELLNLIYEIRYYNLLPVEDDKNISEIKELEVDLRNMQKEFLNKLCENKVVEIFAKEHNINYNISKYIFCAKMSNLNKMLIRLKYEEKKLYIEYLDENVVEKKECINFSNDDFKELTKKVDKKLRIII